MFKNYIIVAFRNVLHHKAYSAINIAGLAIGMACCILIAQYIRFEMSYDQFHAKADRIYRVVRETRSTGGSPSFGMGTSGNLGPALAESYPEIEYAVRSWFTGSWMMHGDKGRYQSVVRIDENFLKVFDFPIGKVVSFKDRSFAPDYTITGVLKDIPDNSTISFGALITTISEEEPINTWNFWAAKMLISENSDLGKPPPPSLVSQFLSPA